MRPASALRLLILALFLAVPHPAAALDELKAKVLEDREKKADAKIKEFTEKLKAIDDKIKEVDAKITAEKNPAKKGALDREKKKLSSERAPLEAEKKKAEDEKKKVQDERKKAEDAEKAKAEKEAAAKDGGNTTDDKGGKPAQGTEKPGAPAADGEDGPALVSKSEAEEARKRNRWIDAEVDFIEKLAGRGYRALAEAAFAALQGGQVAPLEDDQKIYVKRAEVRLLVALLSRITDPAEKTATAEKAVKLNREIAGQLKAGTYLQEEAQQDIVETLFKVGAFLADDGLKENQESLRKAAETHFTDAAKQVDAIQLKLQDRFDDVMSLIEQKKNDAKLLARGQALLIDKGKFQHAVEAGLASWIRLPERLGNARAQRLAEAEKYIGQNLYEYENFLPQDKQVYVHWIRMLGAVDDPISAAPASGAAAKPPEEKNDGKPAAKGPEKKSAPKADASQGGRYDIAEDALPDEIAEAEKSWEHYRWPSDRLRFLFETHFVKWDDRRSGAVPEAMKEKGLYAYAEALSSIVRGAFARAEKETDEKKKQAWIEHGERLLPDAVAALEDSTRPTSKLLRSPISPAARAAATLNLRADFHLFQARRLAATDKEKGKAEVLAAFSGCATLLRENPEWKALAQTRMFEIEKLAKDFGVDLSDNLDTRLAAAERKMREAQTCRDSKQQRTLYVEAGGNYALLAQLLRKERDRDRRARLLPGVLDRLSVCRLTTEDYAGGYLASFDLLQQFNPRRYPAAKYPELAPLVARHGKNLLYASQRLVKAETSELHRELYADALLLVMNADPGARPEMRPSLVTQLKNTRMFRPALEVIRETPPEHPYLRLLTLMGADIAQAALKAAEKERARLDPAKDADAIAALGKEASEWAALSVEFADRFVQLWRKRPALPADAAEEAKALYQREDEQLPGAYLIPIVNAFSRGKFDEALGLSDGYLRDLASLSIEPKLKEANLAPLYRIRFNAVLSKVDAQQGDPAAVQTQFEAAEKILPEFEKVPDEKARGEIHSEACLRLGKGWNALATRLEKEKNDVEAANKAKLRGNDWLKRVESAIYSDMALALMIGRNYFEQSMHAEAVDIYDKMIRFWGESLYLKEHLFAPGKTLADFKASAPAAAVNAKMGSLLTLAAITGAGDEEKLVEALNAAVQQPVDYAKGADAARAAFQAATEAARDNAALARTFGEMAELVGRPDLVTATEVRQRLNRALLDAAWPAALAGGPATPFLPAPAAFDAALGGIATAYPATPEGRRKRLLIRFLHDPAGVTLKDDLDQVNAYRADLKKRIETAPETEKAKLAEFEKLFSAGLKLTIYGGKAADGKPVRPNYARARGQIDALQRFDAMELKLEPPVPLPTKAFLGQVAKTLQFQTGLVQAKKKYAESLVAVNRQADALKYLAELKRFYPDDPELLFLTIGANTAVAVQAAQKDYDPKTAEAFLAARIEASDLIKKSGEQSPLWWQGFRAYLANDTAEILARKAKGKISIAPGTFKVERIVLWKGKQIKQIIEPPLELEGTAENPGLARKTVVELHRLVDSAPLEGTNPVIDECVEGLRGLIRQLEEAGFRLDPAAAKPPEPPAAEKPAEPAAPAAAEATEPPPKPAEEKPAGAPKP